MADKEGSINIYARLRKIMPWEDPILSATALDDRKILNRTAKRQQAYEFTQVFKPSDDNPKCFKHIGVPLLSEVQRGYNAILMAYGQTGSGKTYSVLGKMASSSAAAASMEPKNKSKCNSVKGLLTLSLEHLLSQENVSYLELSAIETFGHHIQKIRLFDLAHSSNEIAEWDKKVAMKSCAKMKNAHRIRLNADNIESSINKLHRSSHFAPTGKNPESSRGHICYVTRVHLKYFVDDDNINEASRQNMNMNTNMNAPVSQCNDLIAHWIVVDLAGSEGESAINSEFQKRVEASEVMARRLEAWCINHGLSQLQVIFNELRGIKKKGFSVGTGLKKTLSEFISNESFISVLFTISPSQDNSKSTEATLRFAESAALVQCSPVKTEKRVNKDVLIDELNKFIQKQSGIIEEKKIRIAELEQQVLDAYLLEQQQPQTPAQPPPQPQAPQHVETASISLIALEDNIRLKPLQQESRNDLELELQLPSSLRKQLDEFAVLIHEEKAAQDIWTATKSEFISFEDEEDLEQSMKDQMSDIRRASRVSSDVQFVANLLSLSDHSEIGFNEDIFRINALVESDDEAPNNTNANANANANGLQLASTYKVQKILNDYANGYQLLQSSLANLNKSELMYLCTRFAKYNDGFHHNETDKIIESHEEQIQFLTMELNRLQRFHDNNYHHHNHNHSLSLQSDAFQLHVMMDDDMDEKFEPIMNARDRDRNGNGGNGSPSSTRIDPIAAYNHNIYESAPLVKPNSGINRNKNEHKIVIHEDDDADDADDADKEGPHAHEKGKNKGCADHCVVL